MNKLPNGRIAVPKFAKSIAIVPLFIFLAACAAPPADADNPPSQEMEFSEDEGGDPNEMEFTEEEIAGDDGMEFTEEEAAEPVESLGYDFLDEMNGVISWTVTYQEGDMNCPDRAMSIPADTETVTGYFFFFDGGQTLQLDGLSEQGSITVYQDVIGPGGAFYKGTQNFGGAEITTELEIFQGISTIYGSFNSVEGDCIIKRPFEMVPAE